MNDAEKHEIHFKDFADEKKRGWTKFTVIAVANNAHALKNLQMDMMSGRKSGRIFIVFETTEVVP